MALVLEEQNAECRNRFSNVWLGAKKNLAVNHWASKGGSSWHYRRVNINHKVKVALTRIWTTQPTACYIAVGLTYIWVLNQNQVDQHNALKTSCKLLNRIFSCYESSREHTPRTSHLVYASGERWIDVLNSWDTLGMPSPEWWSIYTNVKDVISCHVWGQE